jgi:polyisoprenyl-phosphate glycosyltransferase
MLISIVIPVYQAKKIVHELLSRIKSSLQFANGDYQVILVDDGSSDGSWNEIENICAAEKNVLAVKLSRNFGQHHAITAGLDYCTGEWVVVMDCDLQDSPEEIQRLYNKAQEGYNIVFARRINRKDAFSKKIFSKLFYSVFSYLTGIKYDGTIGNFGIYHKKVIESVNKMREPMRAFSPMVRWVGFNKGFIDVEHGERLQGKSTYSYKKVFALASDIILSYSDKPLRLIVRLGFYISFISFLVGIYYLIRYLSGKILVSGYASIIISIWFLGGLIILILGVIGLYISKIFSGIKNRPLYIIDKKLNF